MPRCEAIFCHLVIERQIRVFLFLTTFGCVHCNCSAGDIKSQVSCVD